MSVLVEICCGSVEDVVEAQAGGADRVELCSALFLGGLTPSIGVVREARSRAVIPIVAMIRPRPGGFCYSESDFASMERDVVAAIEAGANGLVFGVLTSEGEIDTNRCRRLVDLAMGRETVFHRAFDATPNAAKSLEELVDLGITRVLTSGQRLSSMEGFELISQLVAQAADRIEILAGGGIRPGHAAEFVKLSGCRQIHLAAHKSIVDLSTRARPDIRYGDPESPPESDARVVDRAIVAEVVGTVR